MVKDIGKELQLVNADGLRANFYDIVASRMKRKPASAPEALPNRTRRRRWRSKPVQGKDAASGSIHVN